MFFMASMAVIVNVLLVSGVSAAFSDILTADFQPDYVYEYVNGTPYNVNFAGSYFTYIDPASSNIDTMPGTNTSAWLAFYLAPFHDGDPPGTGRFTQAGTMTIPDSKGDGGYSLTTFVESEAGIICYYPWMAFPINSVIPGCMGPTNSYVSFDQYTAFSIHHGNGAWYTGVADASGSATIAQFGLYNAQGQYYDSGFIFRAEVAAEQIYTQQDDPTAPMSYFFYHPQYYAYGVGYTDWPGSPAAYDPFSFSRPGDPNAPSCLYGGYFGYSDPRLWYVGSGGSTCSHTF
jgi:hypothetical protein